MVRVELKGRGYVEGVCMGSRLVVFERLNLYGDTDPERGLIRGVPVKDAIIVAGGLVGSTVAPYKAYALARRGLAPCALVAPNPDPVYVAAAVLGGFALVGVSARDLSLVPRSPGCRGYVVSMPPRATVTIECS